MDCPLIRYAGCCCCCCCCCCICKPKGVSPDNLASFPRARVYCMTFDPHTKPQGEPGEFYHVSDIKGTEDCT